MTIRLRIALLTALVLAITVGISSIVIVWRIRAQATNLVRGQVTEQAGNIGDESWRALRSRNRTALEDIADRAVGDGTRDVHLTDGKGIVLAENGPDRLGEIHLLAQQALAKNSPVVTHIGATTTGAVPVRDPSGNRVGAVVVTVETERIWRTMENMPNIVSAVWMLATLIGLGLAYLAAGYLTAPLVGLRAAIQRVESGDLTARIPQPPAVPELEEIGEAFNNMTQAVTRRIRQLEQLNAMAAEISKARRLRDIAEAIRNTAAVAMDAAVLVWVFDPTGENLSSVPTASTPRIKAGPSCTVLRSARESRTIIIGEGDADMPSGSHIVTGLPPSNAAVIIPLSAPEGIVGSISSEVINDQRQMTQEQISLSTIIANIAGPAIAALLRTESQARSARMLQRILIPGPPAVIPGIEIATFYQPAEEIGRMGGDYYDFVQLDDNEWCIIMGDVSGKGLWVAQFTAMAKYVVRSYVLEYKSLARALELTSLALSAQTTGDIFITLFCCALDIGTGRMRYARAGHPPPIKWSDRTGVIRLLMADGPPAGILEDVTYEEEEDFLEPGDVLVLYTDGVTEAHDGRELYGEERLIGAVMETVYLSAREITDSLIEDVRSFSGGRMRDDVAIVVIRIL